jgi:hypothetical protein
MRTLSAAVASLLVAAAWADAPDRFGPQPDAKTRTTILALREAAWRSWFSNDAKTFQSVVPQELVALGWGGGAWEDRAQTLREMETFARSGARLTALEFPENVFQHYGSTIILYTQFHVTLTSADGTAQEIRGRGTEIFVLRRGRWIHTGWHLDKATPR